MGGGAGGPVFDLFGVVGSNVLGDVALMMHIFVQLDGGVLLFV